MKKCLQSMCDLRTTHHFSYTQELDRAVGMAVRTMEPSFVLAAVPLQITGDEWVYMLLLSFLSFNIYIAPPQRIKVLYNKYWKAQKKCYIKQWIKILCTVAKTFKKNEDRQNMLQDSKSSKIIKLLIMFIQAKHNVRAQFHGSAHRKQRIS